jgi:class 3 adenylate cyclase/tetratricopeptide (TPR) repeat protein
VSGSVQESAVRVSDAAAERLVPYVPRISLEWLAQTPAARYRAIEGTLVFVDVSGFTALTERLSRKGKIGAEEMNDLLGGCFTEFLDVAYEYGAGVVKWGGDAVLVLFDGDGHEVRACRAAYEMQRTMRSAGRLRTSSGTVTLRMSVGIQSGRFDFFLVGDLHRELVIAGPDATATVRIEAAAEAGEIAIGPTTAAALDPASLGEVRGPAVLLRRPPVAEKHPVPHVAAAAVRGVPIETCLPTEIRAHLLAAQSEAEHRPLTAAFIHFGGTDEAIARDGPAVLADALQEWLGSVQRIVHEHGVAFFDTDIAENGGKIILIAGAPTSSGNDEERMLRAMRAVADAGSPLPLRIGVNWGRIFVADFGPPYRRTYSVKGDAVNLAARLMTKAEPGQILVSSDVLERSRTRFAVVALEPFEVKGKSEPVEAFVLGRVLGAGAAETESAPLIGRDRELEALLAEVESAHLGSGSTVELVGEPGLGKSRLIEEVRRLATGVRTYSVECDEYGASTAYSTFRALLRELLGLAEEDHDAVRTEAALQSCVESRAPHLSAWMPLLGTPLGLELEDTPETALLDERFRRERVHEVTAELLGVLLPGPTLLVFEDAHWMDEASTDLLRVLIMGLELRPWAIVATRREEESGFRATEESGATRIDLLPLDARQANMLLQATTEEMPLLPHELEALAERAGGNPLFLGELLAAARRAGGVDALPDSVESLLMAQIDRLSPADRRLLRCAAVIGVVFSSGMLTEALDDVPGPGVWERLADFLADQGDGHFRFRHALVRDAAYEGLPYRRRRELHASVGETIERHAGGRADEEAELLSLHFFHAHEFEKAWYYSRIAGERAASIYANVEAAAFLERAIVAARGDRGITPDERAAVLETLGDVRFRLGEFEIGGHAFRSARRLLPRTHSSRLRLKEALVPYRLGRYPQALAALTRGLRDLEGQDGKQAEAERARLLVYRGIIRYRQGQATEAIHWLDLAVSSAEHSEAQDALAQAYQNLDLAYLQRGEPDRAVFGQKALSIFAALGNLTQQAGVLNNLAMLAHERGQWTESLELFAQASAMWESAGDAWSASFATYNRGEILTDQGRLDEAEPLLRNALRVWRASHAGPEAAEAMRQLGRVLARKNEQAEALALLETARQDQIGFGETAEALLTGARIAEALAIAGRARQSADLCDRLLAEAGAVEAPPASIALLDRVRGWALILLGRPSDARRALEHALLSARERGSDHEAALALGLLAEHGLLDRADVEDSMRQRRETLERLGVQAFSDLPLV